MRKFHIGSNLVNIVKQLCNEASSTVCVNGQLGEWFYIHSGVRQGCLLSSTLFNVLLERLISEALKDIVGTTSIGRRIFTKVRSADDIDSIDGSEEELKALIELIDRTAKSYSMKINADRTKVMMNSIEGTGRDIKVNNTYIEVVDQFKYLGSMVADKGSKLEVLSRIAQAMQARARMRAIWKDKNISIKMRIWLMQMLVFSIFLYACKTWTLTVELQHSIKALKKK